MIRSTTAVEIPIPVPIPDPQPIRTMLPTVFKTACLILFQCLVYTFTLVGRSIRGGLVAPVCRLWAQCYPRVAVVEERVVMPHSTLDFIIGVLVAFAQIKAQSQPGFPFKTHPHHIRFSFFSVLVYGLACALELVVSALGLDRTSVFAITARWGKIGSLCVLMATLACLFLL